MQCVIALRVWHKTSTQKIMNAHIFISNFSVKCYLFNWPLVIKPIIHFLFYVTWTQAHKNIICRACFNADLPWKNTFQAWNNRENNGSNENWFFVCNSRFYDIDGPAHTLREFDVFFMFKTNARFLRTETNGFNSIWKHVLNTLFNCTPEPYR